MLERDFEADKALCEEAKQKPWHVGHCTSGETCWCRTISEKPDSDPESEDLRYCIAPSGSIHTKDAEWIVFAREALPYYVDKVAELERQLAAAAKDVSNHLTYDCINSECHVDCGCSVSENEYSCEQAWRNHWRKMANEGCE